MIPEVRPKRFRCIPQAVIFDMDGILVDSERCAFHAWQKAARSLGSEMTENIFLLSVGITAAETMRAFRKIFGPDFPLEEMRSLQREIFKDMVASGEVPQKESAREVLVYLNSIRIPWAVATSTRRESAMARLCSAGLADLVEVLVGGDEVVEAKPAPDLYIKAAEQLGVSPSRSIAIEDSDAGAKSALSAGMEVILIPDMVEPAPEVAKQAIMVVSSLAEFKCELETIQERQ